MAPIKKLVNTNIGALVPGYIDVKAQWAYFKGADSTRVHSFGTFWLLAILCIKISKFLVHVLNKHVNAVVLRGFGQLFAVKSRDMAKNVIIVFYIIYSSLLVTLDHCL